MAPLLPSQTIFEVTPDNGFLPKVPPLQTLPGGEFAELEALMKEIPALLAHDSPVALHDRVHALPELPEAVVAGADAVTTQALYRDFGILCAAYLLEAKVKEGKPRQSVPRVLSIPYKIVADRLDQRMIMSYDSYCLGNHYSLRDDGSREWDHTRLIRSFDDGPEEATFILVHAEIESHTPKLVHDQMEILKVLRGLQGATPSPQEEGELACFLTGIAETQERMITAGVKMFNASKPENYVSKVRPWIFGYKNTAGGNPADSDFPNGGVVFEGCFGDAPQALRGETGAQSTIIPSLDALLGVRHKKDELRVMLSELEEYRPAAQREYLTTIREVMLGGKDKDPDSDPHLLRDICAKSETLSKAFNRCVMNVFNFRMLHVTYSDVYISAFSSRASATGGTPYKAYLRKHRDESLKAQLDTFPGCVHPSPLPDTETYQNDNVAVRTSKNGVPAFLLAAFSHFVDPATAISLREKCYPDPDTYRHVERAHKEGA